MSITFNTTNRNERIKKQAADCLELINTNWSNGVSPVELEVDTDIFREVKLSVISDVVDLALSKMNSKAYSVQGKNNKTRFKVVNRNFL